MSFAHNNKYQTVKYTGLQLQTSTSTACVPLCWGANQTAGNLIYYTDFAAKKSSTKGKGAGKETTTYNYSATIILALSQGVINGIGKVWVNQSEIGTFASTGFTLFLGTYPQAAWSYIVSKHPSEAMGYSGIAYIAKANYAMGTNPSLPSTQMELQGMRFGSQVGGDGNDADCALIIQDFLGNDFYWSTGLPSSIFDNLLSTVDAPTTGDSAFQTYCQAMGFGLSPALTSQEQALSVIDRWTTLTNTAVFWSGYSLKFVPYGDEEITANGVTYLPPITPVYDLTDADYVKQDGEDPVKCLRSDPADAYNSVKLTIKDRSNYYADTPIILQDQNLVELYGLRQDTAAQASEVCVTSMATTMVQLRLQRKAYMRNTYEFELSWKFCLVEPMDVVTITDINLGFNQLSIRITGVEEDDRGNLKIEAEQLTVGVSSGSGFAPQPITNNPQNSATVPDPVNPPVIFEPPSSMTNGIAEIWIALSGGAGGNFDPFWGGCQIWLSSDGGASYPTMIGEVESASNMGVLTANLATFGGVNPDATHTLAVSTAMSDGELIGGTAADAANGMLLSYVDGELISYQVATLTGTNTYDLTNLWRGMFGTVPSAHLSGTQFARLDNVFKYQVPAAYIGVTLYLKFASFNIWNQQLQDLSTCTAYPITPAGTGFGGGTDGVPLAPTGLANAGVGKFTWNANVSTDNVKTYTLYRANGTGALFSTATAIASGIANQVYTDATQVAGQAYTYFLTATNVVGESLPSSGLNVAASASVSSVVRLYGSLDRKPDAGEELFDIEMIGDEHFKAGLASNLGSCDVAATSTAVFIIKVNGSNVGTATVATSGTTMTWAMSADYNAASGDRLSFYAPSTQDATLSGPRYTFVGSRS